MGLPDSNTFSVTYNLTSNKTKAENWELFLKTVPFFPSSLVISSLSFSWLDGLQLRTTLPSLLSGEAQPCDKAPSQQERAEVRPDTFLKRMVVPLSVSFSPSSHCIVGPELVTIFHHQTWAWCHQREDLRFLNWSLQRLFTLSSMSHLSS